MKLIFWIIGVIAVLGLINYQGRSLDGDKEKNAVIEKIEELNPLINVQKTVIQESEKMQVRASERAEEGRIRAFNAEKIRIYVRAKDTKTCMKLLKIDVINNEVAECNRDRYVEVRNDELENFKKEQGL